MWKIDRLKPHPRQAELRPPMADCELKELADDIQARGLQQPIVILPDGTIVMGHQRWRACRLLGWTRVPVKIDVELAKQGAVAVERALILDNATRGHFDELTQARHFHRLMELERRKPAGELTRSEQGELRDRIARKIGRKAGRSMSRRLQVLRTPIEVQTAYQRDELTLEQACAVERLPELDQLAIARSLSTGAKAAEVISTYLPAKKSKDANAAFAAFVRLLDREASVLDEGLIHQVSQATDEQIASLAKGKSVVQRLLTQAKRAMCEQLRHQRACEREWRAWRGRTESRTTEHRRR